VLSRRLRGLVELFVHTVFDSGTNRFGAFFDRQWNPKSTVYSYGHDVESAWLLTAAADVLADEELMEKTREIADRTIYAILEEGIDHELGGLYNLGEGGQVVDTDKHWWAQAEAVVGFLNAFERSGEARFLEAALRSWRFAHGAFLDHGCGDWHARLDRAGRPYAHEEKLGLWKCPYHNSRMCLEVMRRWAVS
jgi:cellobiose epimerase